MTTIRMKLSLSPLALALVCCSAPQASPPGSPDELTAAAACEFRLTVRTADLHVSSEVRSRVDQTALLVWNVSHSRMDSISTGETNLTDDCVLAVESTAGDPLGGPWAISAPDTFEFLAAESVIHVDVDSVSP